MGVASMKGDPRHQAAQAALKDPENRLAGNNPDRRIIDRLRALAVEHGWDDDAQEWKD